MIYEGLIYEIITGSNPTAQVVSKDSSFNRLDLEIPSTIDINGANYDVTRINNDVFKDTTLNSISFPSNSNIIEIGNNAFQNVTPNKGSIISDPFIIRLPNSLTKIGTNCISFPDNSNTYVYTTIGISLDL